MEASKYVCVIGAGPSGLVTIKELFDEGHRVKCFERYDRPGGVFNLSNDESRPGAYDSTKLTISNYMMAFSSFPPKLAQERRYWSGREYARYLHDFSQHFGLSEAIEYSTEVESVRKLRDGRYCVDVRANAPNGQVESHVFDRVAVATGSQRIPRYINVDGLSDFTGEVKHAGYYRNAANYKDKRVLCIGLGETAADVAAEIASVAASCTLSVRRRQPVVERYPLGKPHTNDAYTSHLLYWLPTQTRNAIMKLQFAALSRRPATEREKILADWNLDAGDFYNHFFTKNERFIDSLVDGSLQVNTSGIARFEKDGVVFNDGKRELCDAVVMNTGYEDRFPFIKDATVEDVRHLYKHMIHPDLGAEVVFIGWARPAVGGVPACSEMQARYFALLCSGKRQLPERPALEKLIERQANYEEEVYFGNPEIRTLVHYSGFMHDFANVIGCSPWRAELLKHPRLAYRLWSGSQMPYIYRLFGPHSDFDLAKKTIFNVPTAFRPLEVLSMTGLGAATRLLGALHVAEPDPEY